MNTIKSDCRVNAAERALRAVGEAIKAEQSGYDYRCVIIAAQNVVPELKDMNQIVQCIGMRGSNLQALHALQLQFIKELEALRAFEELTKPVNQEGPKVIYVVRYAEVHTDAVQRRKYFETHEVASSWVRKNRHAIIHVRISEAALN